MNSPLTEHNTSSTNHLFTLHTAAHAGHRVTIPIVHVNIARNLCSGWSGAACRTECILHKVVTIENVMTFATAVPILFTSFVYRTNVYWSVFHGIKRKSHLSVVWNWYHFVAIAILHQPRPTDSADMNTRLQLSDTSSIPPMHGGFLLICVSKKGQKPCTVMVLTV